MQDFVNGIFTDGRPDDQRVSALLTQRRNYFATLNEAFYDEAPILRPISSPPPDPSQKIRNAERVPNRELYIAVQDGIREGVKVNPDKFAELLAKHLHKALLRGPKGQDAKDYRADLETLLSLLGFTDSSTDVFSLYYHRTLAKRLLLESSASLEDEAFIMEKLIAGTPVYEYFHVGD